jgi:hypothetical protein
VWQFARPPIATATVGVDQHDRLQVNDRAVQTPSAGGTVELAVLVPSRITARLVDAHVRAPSVASRVDGSTRTEIVLEAQPTELLRRVVTREIERFLLDCTEQRVLLPTGCPFGRTVIERVVDPPTWQLVAPPEVEIMPGEEPGRWSVVGDARLQLVAQLQRLRDGRLSELDETVSASIRGEVVLTVGAPVLTIYSPRD